LLFIDILFISKTGDLALELGSFFYQLDINPLVFSEGQWIALDAKLVFNPNVQVIQSLRDST